MAKLNVLKGKLTEKNATYADCAKELGISITTFSKKMNGQSKFTVDEANKISCFINLSGAEKINIFLD